MKNRGNNNFSYGCVGGYGFDTCSVCNSAQRKLCEQYIKEKETVCSGCGRRESQCICKGKE